MTANEKAAGIASTIRSGITQAFSKATNFIAKLPVLDAALLAAIVGGVFGLVSGAKP